MQCSFLLSWTLQNQFLEGGIGFEYVRDLHSALPSAIARHSLKLTGSPLHSRAFFFDVRPIVISGNLFGLDFSTRPVSNCRLSHRYPSNVASPTRNPVVLVAIKLNDIEPLK